MNFRIHCFRIEWDRMGIWKIFFGRTGSEAVCIVLRTRKEPLSITWEFLKSIVCLEDQACLAMLGLYIPHVFFLSCLIKTSARFSFRAPWTFNTWYDCINQIWLQFNRRSEFRRRKLLL